MNRVFPNSALPIDPAGSRKFCKRSWAANSR